MAKLTKKDILQYITTIRINFENAYKTQSQDEMVILVNSWYECLKDYPKEICDKATLLSLKHAKFAPRLGDIVEQIEKMQCAVEKTKEELWAELKESLSAVSYHIGFFGFDFVELNGLSQEQNARLKIKNIFTTLSPELRNYLRTDSALIELANYSPEQLSYEKGRFMRDIPLLRERSATIYEMGNDINALVGEISNKMALDYKK